MIASCLPLLNPRAQYGERLYKNRDRWCVRNVVVAGSDDGQGLVKAGESSTEINKFNALSSEILYTII